MAAAVALFDTGGGGRKMEPSVAESSLSLPCPQCYPFSNALARWVGMKHVGRLELSGTLQKP